MHAVRRQALRKSLKFRVQCAAIQMSTSSALSQDSHTAVMLGEVAAAVQIGCNDATSRAGVAPDSRVLVLDGTVGGGSHARAILERNPNAIVLGVDRDQEALEAASRTLRPYKDRVLLAHASFAMLPEVVVAATEHLRSLGVPTISSCENLASHIVASSSVASQQPSVGHPERLAGDRLAIPLVGAAVLDLGLNSAHVDDASRGFSFRRDGPLDMRFDRRAGKTTFFETHSSARRGLGHGVSGGRQAAIDREDGGHWSEEEGNPGSNNDAYDDISANSTPRLFSPGDPVPAAVDGSLWVWPRPAVFTAADLVSRLPTPLLRRVFEEMGQEPRAELCAGAVAHWRGAGKHRRKLQSTMELRYVLDRAVSALEGTLPDHLLRHSGKRRQLRMSKTERWISAKDRRRTVQEMERSKPWNPAVLARCFQALRCAVNSEMAHVRDGIAAAGALVAPGGTMVSLAFQPAEDRTLRRFARVRALRGTVSRVKLEDVQAAAGEEAGEVGADSRVRVAPESDAAGGGVEGAIRPSRKEVRRNPRARSAHMHALRVHSPRLPTVWGERQAAEVEWLRRRGATSEGAGVEDNLDEEDVRGTLQHEDSDEAEFALRSGSGRSIPRSFGGGMEAAGGQGRAASELAASHPEASGRLTGRGVFFPSWVEVAMVKTDRTRRWQRKVHKGVARAARHAKDEAERRKEVALGVGLEGDGGQGGEISIRLEGNRPSEEELLDGWEEEENGRPGEGAAGPPSPGAEAGAGLASSGLQHLDPEDRDVDLSALSELQGIRASRLAAMQADMVRRGVPVQVDVEALQGLQGLLDLEVQGGRHPMQLHKQPSSASAGLQEEAGDEEGSWVSGTSVMGDEDGGLEDSFDRELLRGVGLDGSAAGGSGPGAHGGSTGSDPEWSDGHLDDGDDLIALAEAERGREEGRADAQHEELAGWGGQGSARGVDSGDGGKREPQETQESYGEGSDEVEVWEGDDSTGIQAVTMDPDVLDQMKRRAMEGGMSKEEAEELYSVDGPGGGAAFDLDLEGMDWEEDGEWPSGKEELERLGGAGGGDPARGRVGGGRQ